MQKINSSNINSLNKSIFVTVPLKTNFRGNFCYDRFEKQSDDFDKNDFENISKDIVIQAHMLEGTSKKYAFDLLKDISKSKDKKGDLYKIDKYQFGDIVQSFDVKSEKLKERRYLLMKALIQEDKFPNDAVGLVASEFYTGKNKISDILKMAKFLESTTVIEPKDYPYILSKIQTSSDVNLQIDATKEYLSGVKNDEKTSYVIAENVKFLITNLKTEDDKKLKLSCVNNYENLSDIQKIAIENLPSDKSIKQIVKTINFIADYGVENFDDDTERKENAISTLCSIINLKGVEDLDSCTFSQKEQLLNFLRTNSLFINDFKFKDEFPIVPNNAEEFKNLIQQTYDAVYQKEFDKQKIQKSDVCFEDIDFENTNEVRDIYLKLAEKIPLKSMIKASNSVNLKERAKVLKDVLSDDDYKKLSDNEKMILSLASIISTLGSKEKSLLEVKKMYKLIEMPEKDFKKVYTIINQQDFLKDSQRGLDLYSAMSLRDADTLKLAIILSKAKNKDIDLKNSNFTKQMEMLKSTDFILPQSSTTEVLKACSLQKVGDYDLMVANSSDIKDFHALVHATETGFYVSQDEPAKKLEIVKTFDKPDNESVICCSYINSQKSGTAGDYGVIINASPYDVLAANGYDLMSPRFPNLQNIAVEFFKNSGDMTHRDFVSNKIKQLNGMSKEEYKKVVQEALEKTNGESVNFEELQKISPKYADMINMFLQSENDDYEAIFMKNDGSINEVLVKNPFIQAIYTKSLECTPKEYLKFAKQNNLPIVVIN